MARDYKWHPYTMKALPITLFLACFLLQFIELADGFDRRQFIDGEVFDLLQQWMWLGSQQGHLPCSRHRHIAHSLAPRFCIAFAFQLFQNLFRTMNDRTWNTGQLCD